MVIRKPEADASIILGLLQVYLGWDMFGATWDGHFDFIGEKDNCRPQASVFQVKEINGGLGIDRGFLVLLSIPGKSCP